MSDFLEQGIAAVKAGDKAGGRALLIQAIKETPDSERAWGWLYNAVTTDKERIQCLKQILRINPQNEKANQTLEQMTGGMPELDPPTQSVVQVAPNAVVQQTGPDGISIIMIVLLIGLGVFWIGAGLIQIVAGQTLNSTMMCDGIFNIFLSLVNLIGISDVVKRSPRVPREMTFLAIMGCLYSGIQLFIGGGYLQACVIPFYVALGVLANVNKSMYVGHEQEGISKLPKAFIVTFLIVVAIIAVPFLALFFYFYFNG